MQRGGEAGAQPDQFPGGGRIGCQSAVADEEAQQLQRNGLREGREGDLQRRAVGQIRKRTPAHQDDHGGARRRQQRGDFGVVLRVVQDQDQGFVPGLPPELPAPVVEPGGERLHLQRVEQMAEYVPGVEPAAQPEPVEVGGQHPPSGPGVPGTGDPVGELRSAQSGGTPHHHGKRAVGGGPFLQPREDLRRLVLTVDEVRDLRRKFRRHPGPAPSTRSALPRRSVRRFRWERTGSRGTCPPPPGSERRRWAYGFDGR